MTRHREARTSGILLIGATLSAALVMGHHPTLGSPRYDSVTAEIIAEAGVNQLVHGAMICAVLAFAIALGGVIASLGPRTLGTRAASTALAFATGAMSGAALLSGFLTTQLAYAMDAATGVPPETLVLIHTGNQVLAEAATIAYAAAIALMALRMLSLGGAARLVGFLGLAIGALLAGLVGTGTLTLDVDGMGIALALMGVWFVCVGAWMLSPGPGASR